MDADNVDAAGYGYGYSEDPLFDYQDDTILAGLRKSCCDGLAFSNGQDLMVVTSDPIDAFNVNVDTVAVWFADDSGRGDGFEACFDM